MDVIHRLQGKRVYLDTNIFIYLLEGNDVFARQIEATKFLIANGECEFVSSELVYTEILPKVVRSGNVGAITSVMQLLGTRAVIEIWPVSQEICIQAGVLRGQIGLKTPDALHVATALASACAVFLTNDRALRLPRRIERVLFSEIGAEGA